MFYNVAMLCKVSNIGPSCILTTLKLTHNGHDLKSLKNRLIKLLGSLVFKFFEKK
jgi:hypothetical protein